MRDRIRESIENMKVSVKREGAINVPQNSFMNWFGDRIRAGNIKMMFNYIDSNKYKWISEAISKQKINSWNNATPIFISAQTGTGKNTFIRKTLLKKIHNDNMKSASKHKILLLSNRIALNRQGKLQYADYLHELTGDKRYKDIFAKYSIEGIDSYIDFGIIDICSYHQLLERKLLDNNQYKYIICDECHFFTSDSTFNNKTDKILEYIISGNNSIRIYMTATIETVFEAIIREETKWIEDNFQYWENFANTQRPNNVISQFNMNIAYNEGKYPYHSSFSSVIDTTNRNIDNALKNKKASYQMPFLFYYMSRNYDYIENIYVYKNHNELTEAINRSKDKWLIFVPKLPSQNAKDELNDISKKMIELSREKINNNENDKKIYDDIVNQEKFNADVLISTSLLDNGINIKDEKVTNVVIDIFDRVEFIQMLGRIRMCDNQKINLYIKDYTIDDLKKLLKNKINLLTLLLQMDLLNKEERIKYYDIIMNSPKYNSWAHNPVRMFRISDDKTYDYNVNAVIQLIDSAKCIFRLIRNEDKNYVVKLNTDDMDRLIRVRNYYANGDGQYNFWSRSIIDLVETEFGLDERRTNINHEKNMSKHDLVQRIEEKYSFKFDDTFYHHLYGIMIPNHFDNLILQRIENIKNADNWRYYKLEFDKRTNGKSMSHIDKLKVIQSILIYTEAIDISREENCNQIINYYQELSNTNTIKNSLDEQVRWLEKFNGYKSISEDENTTFEDSISHEESIKQNIIDKIITEKEYQENKVTNDNGEYANKRDRFEPDFITQKGIKNDSKEAEWLNTNYCGRAGAKNLKGKKFTIEDDLLEVRSVEMRGNHDTYYLLVKVGK